MRPRIRTIKPDFFASPDMNTIGVGSRYIAIGLMSMADDRGRIHLMIPAMRGYIFPAGEITEKQFEKALSDVERIGFAWRYIVEPWTYLWLPKFWKHQKINRPSESPLPPHPKDPYGHLNVTEALAQFTEDSRNDHGKISESSVIDHGSFTASRARARSDPFLSQAVHLSEQLSGRVRANDPKANPDPHSERWLTDMRLLLQDRGGDADEVARIIDWCQSDAFWRSNILSPGKLRKQFTQLLLKAESSNLTPIRVARDSEPDKYAAAALRRTAEVQKRVSA